MAKAKKIHKLRYVYSDVVSLVNTYLNKKGKVLEIGCGTGNNLVFFSENGWDTYGIDINKKAVDYAHKLLKSKNLEANIKIGNAEDLPYKDKKFDLVLDRACLQHNRINSIKKIIKEVYRVLKRGGYS
ncbi:class I SAM-dependent methyltransferase [Candidatus Falkowbacteria bacterium]|nr:class I SAM-dependent methyltransferase [Candidatus Falkowbacteria bacterium]